MSISEMTKGKVEDFENLQLCTVIPQRWDEHVILQHEVQKPFFSQLIIQEYNSKDISQTYQHIINHLAILNEIKLIRIT